MLGATLVALVWANSPWASSYQRLLHVPLGVSVGRAALNKPLLLWINDGLMGIFFFLVGLEIKRELLVGELARPRKAALAVAAALGGMLVPAALFVAAQQGQPAAYSRGWGVPMSTDIAFALGLLALLGDRVPPGLRVFLAALAIVDDIGAVLVIAVFYTDTIAVASLVAGLLVFALAIVANRARVRNPLFYFLLGTLVWLAFLKSGVHATIAALLMAFVIPARTATDPESFARGVADDLREFNELPPNDSPRLHSLERERRIDSIGRRVDLVRAPLQWLEHQLEPVVKRLVLPVFALANAGVAIDGGFGRALAHPVSIGIVIGLCLGKPLGIVSFSYLAVRLRLAELPAGIRWAHVAGAGMLAGVGFTMALFVSSLAFEGDQATVSVVSVAKVSILVGSIVSAVAGLFVLNRVTRAARVADAGPVIVDAPQP
ncbi:MAG: Na+/H+ antiporter NhaA [Myxococcales bacterium]|nr:Na+/H+ antiporter NhaA [Myxococcales bacterium]